MYPEGKFPFFSEQSSKTITDIQVHAPSPATVDFKTALHVACVEGDLMEIKRLYKSGASIFSPLNDSGLRPLHVAAIHNHEGIVSYILDKQTAELYEVDEQGLSAMLFSILHHENIRMLQIMIKEDNDWILNQRDNTGMTPLHYAVQKRSFIITQYLIKRGAGVNIFDYDSRTPFQLARENGFEDIALFLLSKGAKQISNRYPVPAIHRAAARGDVDTIHLLLRQKKSNVNELDPYGGTPLHWASFHGKINAVRYLLKMGALVNVKDRSNYMPIHCVVMRGDNIDIVECLILAGALDYLDPASERILMYAATQFSCYKTVDCLLSYGVKIDRKDRGGHTVLHTLCDLKMFKVLLGHSKMIPSREKNIARILRHSSMFGHDASYKTILRQESIKKCMTIKCNHNSTALWHIMNLIIECEDIKSLNEFLKIFLLFIDHVFEIEDERSNLLAYSLRDAVLSGLSFLKLPADKLKITVDSRGDSLKIIENLDMNDIEKVLFILYQCVNSKISSEKVIYCMADPISHHSLLSFIEDQLEVVEHFIDCDFSSMKYSVYENAMTIAKNSFTLLMRQLFIAADHLPVECKSLIDGITKDALEILEIIYKSIFPEEELEILKNAYEKYFAHSALGIKNNTVIMKQSILDGLCGAFSDNRMNEKIVIMLVKQCSVDAESLLVLRERPEGRCVAHRRCLSM